MTCGKQSDHWSQVIGDITTADKGVSVLHSELQSLGLHLSVVEVQDVKLLDGNPPETYDDWV
jgi:hypothetical protein